MDGTRIRIRFKNGRFGLTALAVLAFLVSYFAGAASCFACSIALLVEPSVQAAISESQCPCCTGKNSCCYGTGFSCCLVERLPESSCQAPLFLPQADNQSTCGAGSAIVEAFHKPEQEQLPKPVYLAVSTKLYLVNRALLI